MKKVLILALIFLLMGCQQKTLPEDIEDQYILLLTNELTGKDIKETETKFTIYKNGTMLCGEQLIVDSEDDCYRAIELNYLINR